MSREKVRGGHFGDLTATGRSISHSEDLLAVGFRSVLAVLAHPDDESFGLGAVLTSLIDAGIEVSGLCFTHGEASTLGSAGDLYSVRAQELAEASAVLGLDDCRLLDYPDGLLSSTPLPVLAGHVVAAARQCRAGSLVVFDERGITGHPDHEWATAAALEAAEALGLPVLAWAVSDVVASRLNAQFGTAFSGRSSGEIDFVLAVDRSRQLEAIACHRSQSHDNPVLRSRLELTGRFEPLRWLRPPEPRQGR